MSDATSIRLRRAAAGDRESLGWVVAHFDPFVIAQVRLRAGASVQGPDETRDIVDEIWLVTIRKVGELRPRENRLTPVLLKFIVTTSFNVCNNHLRRTIAQRAQGARIVATGGRSVTPSIARIAARQRGVPT